MPHNPDTKWVVPDNPGEEQIAEARRALENLVKLLARVSAKVSHELGIAFDMDDPKVARDVMMGTFEALFLSEPRTTGRRKKKSPRRRDPSPGAAYTAAFVRSALPQDAKLLLEIGCGEGRVAALLQGAGYEMIGLDPDEEAVGRARDLGVDARVSRWPDFRCGPVDAVLFTRSLHHIHPLDESVRAAFDALGMKGVVIVEDFAYDEASEAALGWLRSTAELLIAVRAAEPPAFVADLIAQKGDLRSWWLADHDHELHKATAIGAALAEHAETVETSGAAYYFRYLEPMFEGDPMGLQAMLRHEEQLIGLGLIPPLGRRFLARARG